MKRGSNIFRLNVLIFLILFGWVNSFQIIAQITPDEVISLIQRGINLGNTLEPPNEAGWNNDSAQAYYFDLYKETGFTCIRIPIRWDEHTLDISPYTVDEGWMNRVEQIIDWGLDRDLFIIINAHHEEWIKVAYDSLELRNRFDSIWIQIAVRFSEKSEKLFFEIINEPYGMTLEQVNDMNTRVLSIIRKTNPTRIVLFSGHNWSGANDLIAADIPDDDYIMGYFHSYDPWNFAGEANGTWGTLTQRNALISIFDNVADWSETNNIPVFLGEFGAQRRCDYNSRMLHYSTYVEESIKHNFAFSAWDDGGDFQIMLREDTAWNEIKDILINTYPDGPTLLNGEMQNNSQIVLNWTNRTDQNDSIFIERRLQNTGFERIAALAPESSSYTDTNVELETYYYYRVIAYFENDSDRYSYPHRIIGTPTGLPKTIAKELTFYPNPAQGIITVVLNNVDFALIKIFNSLGEIDETYELRNGIAKINLTEFKPGTYLIHAENNNDLYTNKIIITK